MTKCDAKARFDAWDAMTKWDTATKFDPTKLPKNDVAYRITDIRIGSKTVMIPQKKAAPQKVECKTVVIIVNGKEFEAVCMPGDEFDLEQGIAIALQKCLFGGTKEYSKTIKSLVKYYKQCEEYRAEQDRIEKKREKEVARKKARLEKRAAEARQARIDEMSEAFLSAMKSYDGLMDSMVDTDNTKIVNMDAMCEAYLRSKGIVISTTNVTE